MGTLSHISTQNEWVHYDITQNEWVLYDITQNEWVHYDIYPQMNGYIMTSTPKLMGTL